MNSSIHIPDKLAERLAVYLEEKGKAVSKNSVIVSALEDFLDKEDETKDWSPKFKSWCEEKIGKREKSLEGLEFDRESITSKEEIF